MLAWSLDISRFGVPFTRRQVGCDITGYMIHCRAPPLPPLLSVIDGLSAFSSFLLANCPPASFACNSDSDFFRLHFPTTWLIDESSKCTGCRSRKTIITLDTTSYVTPIQYYVSPLASDRMQPKPLKAIAKMNPIQYTHIQHMILLTGNLNFSTTQKWWQSYNDNNYKTIVCP